MRDKLNLQLLILLLVFSIILLTLSARGCPKRSRDKIGSSNEWAGIAAPSSLTATAFSSSEIRLSWQDNSNNEDGFEIERRIGTSGIWLLIGTTVLSINSYSDQTIIPFNLYNYRVRAFNTPGDRSEYSNESGLNSFGVTWSSIKAGGNHTIALSTVGTIWTWGLNDFYQLGLGDTVSRTNPTQIGTESNWVDFAAGGMHSLGLKSNKTIWGWGVNSSGQLGWGNTIDDGDIPYQIGSESDWIRTAAGSFHSIALKANGTIWSWGTGGQLGLGSTNERTTPAQIGTSSEWSIVWAGWETSFSLKTNSTIWAWGRNSEGELGLLNSASRTTPTQVGTQSDWLMIAPGEIHTVALKTSGTMWVWGYNGEGQLGLGNSATRWTPTQMGISSDWLSASAGYRYTMGIKTDGSIWGWGRNNYGQLGLGDNINRVTPSLMGTESDWSLVVTGGGTLSTAVTGHTIGIKKNGLNIWAWGYNLNGELGLGDTINRNIPYALGTPLPPSSLRAISNANSQVKLFWIDNSYNETSFKIERKEGNNGSWTQIAITESNILTWLDANVSGLLTYHYRVKASNTFGNSAYSNETYSAIAGNWSLVKAGYNYTVGVKTDNTVWSWGDNFYGQLGLGAVTGKNIPTKIDTATDWLVIAVGEVHAILRKNNGTIWGFGYNEMGQLGLDDIENRNTPTQIGTDFDWSINAAGGSVYTLAIKSDGRLFGWGENFFGQLGLGDAEYRFTPSQIGNETDWSVVAAAGYHTIAIKTNKTLWSWGYNYYGQLGLGDTTDRYTPIQIGAMSDYLSVVAGGSSTGSGHNIAQKTNKTIWSCGYNQYGQLGLGDTNNRNSLTQIGIDSDWSKFSAGEHHTVIMKTNGTLWGWGKNNLGQLGIGSGSNRNTPTQITTDTNWSAIFSGHNHTLASKNNGTLWTWGYNAGGQLGLGDYTSRNTPTLVGE